MNKPAPKEPYAIFVDRVSGSSDTDEKVSVNFRPFDQLPRGKRVTVKYSVAREYERARKAREKLLDTIAAIHEKQAAVH